ncbi:MAG: GatB/YqeY domain-containing protein [Dehalococcoidales bacterium]|nr:GatB/YqeY domain-containing protein [Dehalococcoidales bacterium]
MEQQADLKRRITDDIKQAMKSGDTVKKDTLRMLVASINNAEKAKQDKLDNADILGIIAKEVKKHQESIDAFKQGNRQDLVDKEAAEMKILHSYLPEQLTRDDIVEAAKEVIAAVGAQGPGDKGKVMKELMPGLKGKADGREINEVVTELLGQ